MNKKRLIISSVISIFLVATLLLGSTYSIFTSQEIAENTNVYTTGNLNITYTLDSTNNIIFTDITPYTEEEADGVTPYRITVANEGNVPYMFDVILRDTTSSEENTIDYQYIMTKVGYLESKSLSDCNISDKNIVIKEDVILPAGSSVDIDVRVWIADSIQNTEIGKSFYSKLMIDGLAVYNDNEDIDNSILSLRYMNNSSTTNFKNVNYIDKIKTASFVDYIDTTNASITTDTNEKIIWNMSTNGDVIAWLEDNENEGYYDLYIGAKYKIYKKNLFIFFMDMKSLERINFNNLDTSLTNNMNSMFYNCSSLISLDLSGFDTSNVTNMYYMFGICSSLTELVVSNFDTSNVTNMAGMFNGCSSLTELVVSNFDTSNVTDMSGMFWGAKLTSLDLSNFDTSKVTNMMQMFYSCSNLTSLDLSNFDTSSVTNMQQMFNMCSSLANLDLSNFNTINVLSMKEMFYTCTGLESIDLSNFDTSNVTDMSKMFHNCNNLLYLDLSRFDTSSVTVMSDMLSACPKLTTSITISNVNTTSYTSMFAKSATAEGSLITVNYVGDIAGTEINESTESLVESMVATKSDNSNVEKGICVNCA